MYPLYKTLFQTLKRETPSTKDHSHRVSTGLPSLPPIGKFDTIDIQQPHLFSVVWQERG